MPAPYDLPSGYEYHIYQALKADAALCTLVGNNIQSGFPNIYFQVVDEGCVPNAVYVTFDYASRSRNHDEVDGTIIFADADFQVIARGPRTRSIDIRAAALRIKAALHKTHSVGTGNTDGYILQCVETDGFVVPPYEEDGVLNEGRGGYYNLWVQDPA